MIIKPNHTKNIYQLTFQQLGSCLAVDKHTVFDFPLNSRREAFEPRMEVDIYYLVTAFAHTVVHRFDFAATNNFITDLVWLLELRMTGKIK